MRRILPKGVRELRQRLEYEGRIVAREVKAGDRILFGEWLGTEVMFDGDELPIMQELDIMGIVEGIPATRKKAA